MNQTLAIRKTYASDYGRLRFDLCDPTDARTHERHPMAVIHPQIMRWFCPEWFALRTWEDDGGGQTPLT